MGTKPAFDIGCTWPAACLLAQKRKSSTQETKASPLFSDPPLLTMCIAQDRNRKPKAVSLHHSPIKDRLSLRSIILEGLPVSKAAASKDDLHPASCDETHTTVASKESYEESVSSEGEANTTLSESFDEGLSFDQVPTGGLILLPRNGCRYRDLIMGADQDTTDAKVNGSLHGCDSRPSLQGRHRAPVDLHLDCADSTTPHHLPASAEIDSGRSYATPKAGTATTRGSLSPPPTPKHCHLPRVIFFDPESPLPGSLMIPDF